MSSIGDIKYSILDPEQFNHINESGWVLMRGQFIDGTQPDKVDEPSRLFQDRGLKQLPDARGMFIRGMNLGRNVATGDTTRQGRQVGSYQEDTLKKHQHDCYLGISPNSEPQPWGGPLECHRTHRLEKTAFNDAFGEETRPRNIALYIYIKIN